MERSYFGQLLLVGVGGFVGSAARYALGGLVHRLLPPGTFPFGTLAVNVLGCLAIGFLGGLMEVRQLLGPSERLLLMIGVLGGFTTFSTFALETLGLLHGAELAKASLNVGASVVLSLVAVWLGYTAAQTLWGAS